jgi:hypothetical protein
MQSWLENVYDNLSLDKTYIKNISSQNDPYTIFAQIVKVILADPVKYRPLVDEIAASKMVRAHFPPYARNQLSRIYPEDKDLAAALLIDTTTYYKLKDRPTFQYDSDGEEITIPYYSMCYLAPQYYFMMHFYDYPKTNAALAAFLEEHGVAWKELAYYKQNDGLWNLYNKRHPEMPMSKLGWIN